MGPIILFVGIAFLALGGLIFLIVLFAHKKKKNAETKQETADKQEFDESVERFEQKNFKKCRHCGENVPLEDNICQSCNQEP